MKIEQGDIVRFRINSADRDLHPGVVISAAEWCADDRKLRLHVLACAQRVSPKRPRVTPSCAPEPTTPIFRVCAAVSFFTLSPAIASRK